MNLGNFKGVRGIRPDETIPDKPILIVIFAPPGLGKTSLSFTADKPFLMDFDKGVHRARQSNRPFTFPIDDYKSIRQFIFHGLKEAVREGGYKTAILDTVGAMLDNHVSKYLMNLSGKNARGNSLSLQGWGALKVEFNAIKNQLMDEVGVDVIAIAHDKTTDEGVTGLSISGSSKDVIYQSADIIAYIEKNGKDRVITFEPQQERIGKNPGFKSMVIPNFDQKPEAYDKFMSNLVSMARQKMRAQTQAQKDAIETVKVHKQRISGCENFEELKSSILEYSKMSPSYVAQCHQKAGERYLEIYTECYWEGLETAAQFNKAIPEVSNIIKNTPFEPFMNVVKFGLVNYAKERGFLFDKEEVCFKPDPAKKKQGTKKTTKADEPVKTQKSKSETDKISPAPADDDKPKSE